MDTPTSEAGISALTALALLTQLGHAKTEPATLEIAERLKAVLAEPLGAPALLTEPIKTILTATLAPAPPPLEGLPPAILLNRVVPVAQAAELMACTVETVIKNHRDKLIELDGRRYGMRLYDALRLDPAAYGIKPKRVRSSKRRRARAIPEAP